MLAVGIAVLNELLTVGFRIYEVPYRFTTSIYVALHTVVWFLILGEISNMKTRIRSAMFLYIGFTLYNFCFLDGITNFNSYTFILGGLLYVLLFIVDSITELKRENLNYFTSPDYILIASPLLFFICFSFSFGFKTTRYDNMILFNHFTLWDLISYLANGSYYTLINLYIYQNKKSIYAE